MKRRTAALIVIVLGAAGLFVGSLLRGGPEPRATEVRSGSNTDQASSQGAGTSNAPACSRDSLIGTVVTKRVTARAQPDLGARAIASFNRINPEGSPQVFLLTGHKTGPSGAVWFRALLPVRPNGTHGYVPAGALRLTHTPYRLVVNRHRFTLELWSGCRHVRTLSVGIGAGETPTPVGHFYLAALLKPPTPDSIYGVYAYGLSAYSNVITTWKWGGVIGLHGTNDPSSIGHTVSHGCIRMQNKDIEYLVRILPLGTPITIE